jgi:hypothetical protein
LVPVVLASIQKVMAVVVEPVVLAVISQPQVAVVVPAKLVQWVLHQQVVVVHSLHLFLHTWEAVGRPVVLVVVSVPLVRAELLDILMDVAVQVQE